MAGQPRGRAPFIITPLSAFTVGINGQPPIVPYNHEFVFDDLGDKSIGHIEYDSENGTTWKFVSTCQDVNSYMTSLRNTGLFDNAVAGVMSKELTYFLYNLDTRSIIFNNKLVYDDNFRYYAIRKGHEFITGVNYNGNIVNVCDMVRSETQSGSGVYVRKPSIGTILPGVTIVDGDSYIVEFFDSNKRLISRDVFYAEYSNVFTGDVSDSAISSLKIITTRPYPDGGPDSSFIFKGENVNHLAYSLIIEYNNGDSRDVTHETNRITVTGLNTIDTSSVTTNPYTVSFEYDPGDANGITVSTELKVHVITDVTAEVSELLPVYYYSTSLISSLVRRYFAVMNDGSFYEITSKLADDQPTNHVNLPSATNQRSNIETEFNLGLFDQIPRIFTYSIDAITELTATRIKYFNSISSNDDMYKRITSSGENLSLWNTFTAAQYIRDGIVPTHFRLRTIEGVAITGDVLVGNYTSFARNTNTAAMVADKTTPIIVEFINTSSGRIVTKCAVAYFN